MNGLPQAHSALGSHQAVVMDPPLVSSSTDWIVSIAALRLLMIQWARAGFGLVVSALGAQESSGPYSMEHAARGGQIIRIKTTSVGALWGGNSPNEHYLEMTGSLREAGPHEHCFYVGSG